jgi:hypothetical protein
MSQDREKNRSRRIRLTEGYRPPPRPVAKETEQKDGKGTGDKKK